MSLVVCLAWPPLPQTPSPSLGQYGTARLSPVAAVRHMEGLLIGLKLLDIGYTLAASGYITKTQSEA